MSISVSSKASNAVVTKTRAMFAENLTAKNYEEIISCKNLQDLVFYLKRKTTYTDVLKDINESSFHRFEVEPLIRSKLFYDFEKLARYDQSTGGIFLSYFISRAEISGIMHFLTLLSAERAYEFKLWIPKNFRHYTKANMENLPFAKNYDEFLTVMRKSKYHKILSPYKPKDGENIDLTAIETTLHSYVYTKTLEIIKKYIKGEAQKELAGVFHDYIDLKNMIRIIRMKKFYNLSEDYMLKGLIKGGRMHLTTLKKFIDENDPAKMMSLMKETRLGKKWFSKGLDIVDKIPDNMAYRWAKHNIRYSNSAPIMLIAYTQIKEVEIMNLTSLIEGVKHKLPPDEIKKMFIT